MMAGKRETAKALEGSIEKWRAIAAGEGGDDGMESCPLCIAFYEPCCCNGCPVQKATGRDSCAGSPHDAWSTHHRDEHKKHINLKIECPECTRLAKAELRFLEGLRDG